MDTKFCYEKCKIGKAASSIFLELNNSVYAAASDFNIFIENCFKECPYKSTYETDTKNKEL